MLPEYVAPVFSAEDKQLFNALVPFDCWMRQADKHIDFLSLRASISELFKEGGRPAIEPTLFLKLELLMFHDRLSDSQVYARAQTDLAYRRFLGLGRGDHLPCVSSLSRFRARLGSEGHQLVFDDLLKQARGLGLVKNRLRIKDATHILADIAIPASVNMIASVRNKLLASADPFDPQRVAGERVKIETIRTSTDTGNAEKRLLARVDHLRDILGWVDELLAQEQDVFASEKNSPSRPWARLTEAAKIARKVLNGHDKPKSPGKIRSAVDPDARRGKHGEFYDGYMMDIMVDADSELITSINVLPADGNETIDTLTLVEHELSTQGGEIEALSIDGAGFSGELLRELEGKGIRTFVPYKEPSNQGKFTNDQFELSEDESHVTCPAGQDSQYKQRDENRNDNKFRFNTEQCKACELASKCINPEQKFGRSVSVSDFKPEHEMVRERARTEEYAAIKKEHPRVERRLATVVNRYGGRRARYRGLAKVKAMGLMIATTGNVKRILKILDDPIPFAAALS